MATDLPIQRVTIRDAASILGVSKDHVRRMISTGVLPAYRIGTGPRAPIRLSLADVEGQARLIPTVKAFLGGGDAA